MSGNTGSKLRTPIRELPCPHHSPVSCIHSRVCTSPAPARAPPTLVYRTRNIPPPRGSRPWGLPRGISRFHLVDDRPRAFQPSQKNKITALDRYQLKGLSLRIEFIMFYGFNFQYFPQLAVSEKKPIFQHFSHKVPTHKIRRRNKESPHWTLKWILG